MEISLNIFSCPRCKKLNSCGAIKQCGKCDYDERYCFQVGNIDREIEIELENYRLIDMEQVCYDEAKKEEKKEPQAYFKCPSCGRPQIESMWALNEGREYKPKKCYTCGWKPTKKQELSEKSWKYKHIEKTKEMIEACIPQPKTPKAYFESGGLVDIKAEGSQAGYGTSNWGKRGSCWGFAVSPINSLHIPSMTFDLSRKEWTQTIAHETAHLSPKRGKTLADLQELTTWWNSTGDPMKPMTKQEGTKADLLEQRNPEIWDQMEAGWPSNKIPMEYIKDDFKGGGHVNYKVRGDYNAMMNWGAGSGHGHAWFNEYHVFKGILYSKFSEWINDPKQRKATRNWPETYSEPWFVKFGYRNSDGTCDKEGVWRGFKTPEEADLYGDNFFKTEDALP